VPYGKRLTSLNKYMASTGEWHGGKGSKPRDIDYKKYRENYDLIFRSNKEESSEELYDEEKSDKRMNAIGQNGNTGLHYALVDKGEEPVDGE
jgi:hypothetical protein